MKIALPVVTVVAAFGAALPQAADAQSRSECAQHGRDSLRIVWSREGGATEERMLSEAKNAQERRRLQGEQSRAGC